MGLFIIFFTVPNQNKLKRPQHAQGMPLTKKLDFLPEIHSLIIMVMRSTY